MQRIDDEHMRGGGVTLGHVIVDPRRTHGDPFQRRGQRKGIAADLRPGPVGGIFAGARDRHLHQRGGKGREDHHRHRADDAQPIIPPPAEEQREIRQKRDRPGKGRGDGHDRGVMVADMGQFMGDDPGQFIPVEAVHQAACHGDGGIGRIAPGGKGIGLRGVDQIDRGHRQIGAAGQIGDHFGQAGAIARRHGPGLMHAQHHAVGIPPGEHVHRRSHDQRDHHAAAAAQQIAQPHEERGHRGHQHGCLEISHGAFPGPVWSCRWDMGAAGGCGNARARDAGREGRAKIGDK